MAFREIADAWASFYASSPAARSTITFAHLGALVVGGGSAIAADLGTMRTVRRDQPSLSTELDRLRSAHRLVISSLAIVVLSGLALLLADFDSYVASKAFWLKMVFFIALIVNGSLLVRATERTEDGVGHRNRLRLLAIVSVTLWLATTLFGTVVPNVL